MSTSTIACLENLRLLDVFSGGAETNRGAPGKNQTGANNDWEVIQAWLNAHPKESATWRSYRTQADQILLWSVFERGKALLSLNVADIAAYREFIKAPPAKWMAPRGIERWSPHRRPFVGPFAPSSRATAHKVLHALFAWLVSLRYLDFNPWIGNKLTGEERDAVNSQALHALTREQYAFLAKFADEANHLAWGQRAALSHRRVPPYLTTPVVIRPATSACCRIEAGFALAGCAGACPVSTCPLPKFVDTYALTP